MFTIFDEELMKDSYYRKAVDSLPDEQRGIIEENMKIYKKNCQGLIKRDAASYIISCVTHQMEKESFKKYLKENEQEDRNE